MSQVLLILHILVALSMIALILLQHGKGADAGAAFGTGSSNTMFGSVGAMPFLMKITAILAVVFFTTSIALGYFSTHLQKQNNLYEMPQKSVTTDLPSSVPMPQNSADVNSQNNQNNQNNQNSRNNNQSK